MIKLWTVKQHTDVGLHDHIYGTEKGPQNRSLQGVSFIINITEY